MIAVANFDLGALVNRYIVMTRYAIRGMYADTRNLSLHSISLCLFFLYVGLVVNLRQEPWLSRVFNTYSTLFAFEVTVCLFLSYRWIANQVRFTHLALHVSRRSE